MKAERQFQGQVAVRVGASGALPSSTGFGAFSAASRSFVKIEPRTQGFYARYGKRIFDIVFSLTFLILIGSWLFPVIAVVIKLDSSGPALFRQLRVGRGGKEFTCLKFRTMSHQPFAEFKQVERNDPRVTRVGAFLRKTNLDELPQFINVVFGQMSVVGPRPHVPELDEAFAGSVARYSCRNSVRPGVTGLAQISGCRGETRSVREMGQRVRFDIFYIRSLSFGVDLGIIFKTALSVISGDDKAF